jgi:hypothetical protein
MQTPASEVICSYQNWFEQFAANGRSKWFGTVQFDALGGSQRKVINIMQAEVQRICTTMLTNIRNPRIIQNEDLPVIIGYPDSQVAKRKPTARLAEIPPNEGVYYHFLLAVPPDNPVGCPARSTRRGENGRLSRQPRDIPQVGHTVARTVVIMTLTMSFWFDSALKSNPRLASVH